MVKRRKSSKNNDCSLFIVYFWLIIRLKIIQTVMYRPKYTIKMVVLLDKLFTFSVYACIQ